MFDPSETPRLFGIAPGIDFPKAVVAGLAQRLQDAPPEAWARVDLIVNTGRMARRLSTILDRGPARLLPRIHRLGDLDHWVDRPLPPAIPPLRRRLELAQIVAKLIEQEPDLAPKSAVFDLAESLAALFDEMQGEGVSIDDIATLDVSDMSGHWQRALTVLSIAQSLYAATESGALDPEARQRRTVDKLIAQWRSDPPATPVLLVGSTGSRGTTMMLMAAIARLPQGAVILPGFDSDLPNAVWSSLGDALTGEDHPQFRFYRLMRDLDLTPTNIQPWVATAPVAPARNRALSLALRPAPVTDAWMREGPALRDLDTGFADVSLIEAPDPRAEALAIALRLRQAAEDGARAALITPDRMLTRQVTAALDRWRIIPDDSAGVPLHLTPPGRFLRHVADLMATRLNGALLLTLLKHPLTHSGQDRNIHLLMTRDLELELRAKGPPAPDAAMLETWANKRPHDGAQSWGSWAARTFADRHCKEAQPLVDWIRDLDALAKRIAGGSDGTPEALWATENGQAAHRAIDDLTRESASGGDMLATDFAQLLSGLLQGVSVRKAVTPHSNIMIWGTLEARVQGADLVILGGLNEGIWPETPAQDPWLNRHLRHAAGLLLPDRRIGLSAHDFQQAVSVGQVWMTRSIRSEDAETVPSRWLNRLTNLLDGLPEVGGPRVLAAMRTRGEVWCAQADLLDRRDRIAPAPRPAPRPPISARPRQLSVTEIETLIRDPYAIYVRRVLGLKPLNPLVPEADALRRGILLHEILERFVKGALETPNRLTRDTLMAIADDCLEKDVPWPTAQRMWSARIDRFADWFVDSEAARQMLACPIAFEAKMCATLPDLDFVLTGKADRIDRDAAGNLHIYDYKTSRAPSEKEQRLFDKQLLLEAAIAERFGMRDVDPAPVARAVFIGLGNRSEVPAPLDTEPLDEIWSNFSDLIRAYFDPNRGYLARRMPRKESDVGDYDHLARYGEWDRSTEPLPEDVE